MKNNKSVINWDRKKSAAIVNYHKQDLIVPRDNRLAAKPLSHESLVGFVEK